MRRPAQRQFLSLVSAAVCAAGPIALAVSPGAGAQAAISSAGAPATASGPQHQGAAAGSAVSGSGHGAHGSGPAASRPGRAARAGTNLVGNPGAEIGAVSAQGWDTVTIPGWQILRGLPTVVRYGTPGFPTAFGPLPARRGGQLFSGGVGGTAVLRQSVPLRAPGGVLAGGTRYVLSAWLGGTKTSSASVTVRFVSAVGRLLGSRTIGPVGQAGHSRHPGLARRIASGLLPAGTAAAQIDLSLETSLTGADGENGPGVGYDRAIADDLRLSVSKAVRQPPPVVPPVARVPRYQHVFIFYFENQDFSSLIGNTRQAPYLNSLLRKGSLLANLYAEEHPSDGNYLALAGGSTFGAPPTDPLEENPLYTIHARNVGDLLDAAHETWKGYVQSADGPCDDTVHGSYWNDDLPLLYFADIRDRPAYCAAHVVPLESLSADLASTATTPNFAWIGPNDCADMEGCGVRAGDDFLARELGSILRSPAWRTQRSLAIITVDEDNYDDPHPPQRVPTIMLASSGVRRGYVSQVRYTHYSLLRTIEAALALPTLTANDRYAQPVNDVFGPTARPLVARRSVPVQAQAHAVAAGRSRTGSGAASPSRTASVAARPSKTGPVAARRHRPGFGAARASRPGSAGVRRSAAGAAAHQDPTAFVVNSGSGTVTPVDLRTRRADSPISVGADPTAIVAAPNGRTVYVANSGSGTVTPIDTATRRAGRAIRVGTDPRAIAVTPNGRTVYVANSGSGTVTPISTRTDRAGAPIAVGRYPRAIAITPGGDEAFVLDWGSAQVTPISTADNRAWAPIAVGSYPFAISFTPDGSIAYVANFGSDTVTPITAATRTAGRPINVGAAPDALTVTRNGKTVYVVNGNSQSVTPISVATGRAGQAIGVGYSPAAISLSRSGATAYVVNTISGTVTPLATSTGRKARPLSVGLYAYPLAMAFGQDGSPAVVLDTYAGQVSLIDTRTGRVFAPITVGTVPSAVAFAG